MSPTQGIWIELLLILPMFCCATNSDWSLALRSENELSNWVLLLSALWLCAASCMALNLQLSSRRNHYYFTLMHSLLGLQNTRNIWNICPPLLTLWNSWQSFNRISLLCSTKNIHPIFLPKPVTKIKARCWRAWQFPIPLKQRRLARETYPQGDGCCVVLERRWGVGTQMPKFNGFYLPTLGKNLPLPQTWQLP